MPLDRVPLGDYERRYPFLEPRSLILNATGELFEKIRADATKETRGYALAA
ncbi:hypothetical protein Pyrfu_1825 [Pyrolobus fumarii 1A]|uniref:Uncharacterized protein n=1 Tax=Pyrolobus fumarii (strain DSM 11204 / 1A) TaxID=694429 RepID=G0ECV9_PYRF1|nr:hypothetical protein Pyrfu_1825 [Pyrolobus fumarii 1A]